MNRESHDRFAPDVAQERQWHKPQPLLSMTPAAIKMRRHRARVYAREVDAIRTIKGVATGAAIGPVLRAELWQCRHQGAMLSQHALASRFRTMARSEGVPVEQIAQRYATQTVRPSRQRHGERLADLVMERPEWCRLEYLVAAIEPPENGTPNEAYLRAVVDADGREWILVSSFDGSEPMVWPRDDAGLKAAAEECLSRVRAVTDDPTAYDAWLTDQTATKSEVESPWNQSMTDSDFLAHSGEGGMHLV